MALTPTPEEHRPPTVSDAFSAARQTLQNNLARLLAVASETDDGDARSLSKTNLAEHAGIGRSTIHKLLKDNSETEGSGANPDLQTLCKLAEAFNVPLPYLLMSADEWRKLVNAIPTLLAAVNDTGARNIMAEGVKQTQPRKRSQSSLALAKRLNIYEPARLGGSANIQAPHWQGRFENLDLQRRRAIRALGALPDYAHMDKPTAQTAFALCILMGAVTALPNITP